MDKSKQLPVDDWNDQDLLTKDEARGRLVDEIGRTEAELNAVNAAAQPDRAAVVLLERRLSAMRSICGEYDEYLNGQ